jgi:nucleotide-binding universal stress UspA family protein
VVIALDGSPGAELICQPALDLARQARWRARLAQVAPGDGVLADADVEARYVATLARRFGDVDGPLAWVRSVDEWAGPALVALSEDDRTALVAVSTHGRHPLERLGQPSAFQHLVRHGHRPVYVTLRS